MYCWRPRTELANCGVCVCLGRILCQEAGQAHGPTCDARPDWHELDMQAQLQKQRVDGSLVATIQLFVQEEGGRMHIDDVIKGYERLPYVQRLPNGRAVHSIPPRGDLVRIIRRFPQELAFDVGTHEVHTVGADLPSMVRVKSLSRLIRGQCGTVDLTVRDGKRYRGLLESSSGNTVVLLSAFTTDADGSTIVYTRRIFQHPWIKSASSHPLRRHHRCPLPSCRYGAAGHAQRAKREDFR
jgi:hypothetical protein